MLTVWLETCARAGGGGGGEAGADVWRELVAAYAEPQRHYHNFDHIRAMLALRGEHAQHFSDCATVDLAIFLHDVVYHPQRTDNEAASAVWARERLPGLGVAPWRIEAVARMIEMSKHDATSLAGIDPASDLAHFLDLDLSILATAAPVYDVYAKAIRREYAAYPDEIYRPGRANVLRSFLARPELYCSAHFRGLWEQQARANLAREIAALDSSIPDVRPK